MNTPDRLTAMKIEEFVQTLNKQELHYLNQVIVGRLRLLSQLETVTEMIKYRIGDDVQFTDNNGTLISGKIFKMNKKTVSVMTKENIQWNVHPSLLHRNI